MTRVTTHPSKASAPQPRAPVHAPAPPPLELAEAAGGPTVGESTPALPGVAPEWFADVVGGLDVPAVLVVVTGNVLITGREVAAPGPAFRSSGLVALGWAKWPVNAAPWGSRSTRSALTTRRVVASKRGLQVVRVNTGLWVVSRTAVSEGGTTHCFTTS